MNIDTGYKINGINVSAQRYARHFLDLPSTATMSSVMRRIGDQLSLDVSLKECYDGWMYVKMIVDGDRTEAYIIEDDGHDIITCLAKARHSNGLSALLTAFAKYLILTDR